VLVVGLGNEFRGDDGAGIEIARRLWDRARCVGIEVREMQGEPIALLDAWQGHDAVVVVDTMRSGAAPGTIRRLDASHEPLPAMLRGRSSTHAVGLGEAIELARALDRLPARIVVYGVEGRRFNAGAELSDELDAIIPELAEVVLEEAHRSLHQLRGPQPRIAHGAP
jgi:hydrogenase maturation protease